MECWCWVKCETLVVAIICSLWCIIHIILFSLWSCFSLKWIDRCTSFIVRIVLSLITSMASVESRSSLSSPSTSVFRARSISVIRCFYSDYFLHIWNTFSLLLDSISMHTFNDGHCTNGMSLWDFCVVQLTLSPILLLVSPMSSFVIPANSIAHASATTSFNVFFELSALRWFFQ